MFTYAGTCSMRAGACVLWRHMCRDQRATLKGWFFPAFLHLPGLWECDSDYQACVASTSIH